MPSIGFWKVWEYLLQEMPGDGGDVLGMFLKRRRFDPHDIDAVEEILAEFAFGHQLSEVAVGGEDQAGAQAG